MGIEKISLSAMFEFSQKFPVKSKVFLLFMYSSDIKGKSGGKRAEQKITDILKHLNGVYFKSLS